jgi:hypothetical protein
MPVPSSAACTGKQTDPSLANALPVQPLLQFWTLTVPTGRALASGASLVPKPATLGDFRRSSIVALAAQPPGAEPPAAEPPAAAAAAAAVAAGAAGEAGLLYALAREGVVMTLRQGTRAVDRSANLQVGPRADVAAAAALLGGRHRGTACQHGRLNALATASERRT